jgi:menaquinone-dependent protoporphyrinogen IX oxidase
MDERRILLSALLVCPKSKGNTFNVCSYVANNSDAELSVLNQSQVNNLKKYTSIILCSGLIGGKVHNDLLRWLNQIERTSIHENAKIYVFLTWIGRGQTDKSAIEEVKNILEKKKMSLENDYMTCYG